MPSTMSLLKTMGLSVSRVMWTCSTWAGHGCVNRNSKCSCTYLLSALRNRCCTRLLCNNKDPQNIAEGKPAAFSTNTIAIHN